tara:strand:+ start:3640 stop:3954 length:315 start_codon:yes stop_codon:yes gene_type:complete
VEDVKVYMIANLQIHDANRYREYEKGFFPLLKKHGGEFITYDDNIVNVEGEEPMKGRIILFSFPSEDNAKNWYADPEYQALSKHRRASVTTTLTRVNGLPPRGK